METRTYTTMDKEQIYDTQISPLMTQIIAVCNEAGIAMVCSFAIPTEADADLYCTTALPDETGKNPQRQLQALRMLMVEHSTLHMRTTHGDGSQTMTAFL